MGRRAGLDPPRSALKRHRIEPTPGARRPARAIRAQREVHALARAGPRSRRTEDWDNRGIWLQREASAVSLAAAARPLTCARMPSSSSESRYSGPQGLRRRRALAWRMCLVTIQELIFPRRACRLLFRSWVLMRSHIHRSVSRLRFRPRPDDAEGRRQFGLLQSGRRADCHLDREFRRHDVLCTCLVRARMRSPPRIRARYSKVKAPGAMDLSKFVDETVVRTCAAPPHRIWEGSAPRQTQPRQS